MTARKSAARSAKKSARKSAKKSTRKPAKRRASGGVKNPLDRMRETILAWPETAERISHGHPTFWGGKKTFASFNDDHHGDGRVAAWIKSDFDTQTDLVESNPEQFFVPPYVGPSGWVGVRLDRGIDWPIVASILEEGYRSVAPARALRLLDKS